MDNNGIWIGTHSQTFSLDANDRIRTASQQIDIDRSHLEKGTQGGHKVDGSLGAPTVPPDPTAPTLVSATATTLTIEWTHPGDGGSPLTRNFIEYRVEGTTDWTNWYRGETPTAVTRTVITNLQAATAYDVRVHATNAIGNSQWVQSASAFSTLGGTASCPVPTFTGRRKIWTGVLTMGDFTEFPVFSLRGYDSNVDLPGGVSGDGGGLDPVTFTLGSRDYDITRIALVTSGGSGLNFIAGQGSRRDGEWWDSTVLSLRLHVCNTNFDISDSSYEYNVDDPTVVNSNHIWTTDLDWSGVTTRTVHLSLPLNRPATGAPLITGQATVGQELAVDVTGIEDEDGLHDIEYTYQWVRVDADGTSNEADITDATADTYTLTDDDLGKKVKIEVSFSDDFDSDEQRTSAPTDTVTAVAMTTPGVTVSTPAVTVTEEDTTGASYTVVLNSQPTATVTVTVAGHAGTDVTPSPTSLTFTTSTWGTAQTVTVTAGDDADTANDAVTLTHSAASTDTGYEGISIDGVAVTVNDNDTAPATGAPTITGTAEVGQTLTASTTGIADADGLTNPTYTYQWIRVDGTDEADIASANSSTYILGDADLGKTIKVRVSFDDDDGNTETLTSAATATVVAAATAPTVSNVAVTSTPASGTTYYLAGEVIEFTVTFSAPVTVTATPKFAFRLGAATRQAAYASGSDSAALVFARTVQAGEVDRNGISWNSVALALDGGTITQTGATTAARLTHAAQASLEGHRVDAAPPMQVSASVRGLSLVLVYDEALDPASMPATGAYTVTATVGATTTNPAVSEVSIYGIWVTLALDAAPAAGATVTLAYAPPASNPVQDEAGNDAPAFSGQEVKGAAGNTAPTGAPTITGTAEVGETLTAVTTGIADADGLTSVSYAYQWIRVNGTEADIAAENSSTYTLVDADLGTTLKVRVSFDRRPQQFRDAHQRGDGDGGRGGQHRRDGCADHHGHGRGGRDADGGHHGHCRRRRADQRQLRVPVDSGERHGGRHCGREFEHLHPGRRRPGHDPQGAGELHRRRQQFRDAHQRGDGDGGRGGQHRRDGRADHHGHGRGGRDADGGHHGHCRRRRADQRQLRVPVDSGERHGGRHCGREFDHLHPGRRRPGHDPQGAGELHRRRQQFRDAHQRGDGDGGRGGQHRRDGRADHHGHGRGGRDADGGHHGHHADADGLTSVSYAYQWIRVNGTEADIAGENSTTYTLVDADQGTTLKVRVSFTDDASNSETLTSAATATVGAAGNTAATGAPTITGTAEVGETLTAVTTGIADADGLTSVSYAYQWIRVDGTEADIAAENSTTYTLVDADLGTTLKVRVSFTDDASNSETLTSAATATVGATATAPTVSNVAVTSTPASGTTYYLAGEVIEFTVTFSAPVTVTATPKFAFRLGAATRQAAYASGSDSAALVFARTVQAGEVDRNGISWNALALALDGGTITQTGATTAARLTHAEQASLEGHRVDAAPPMQVSASVRGLSLVLVYDEPLDPASMPATGAYTVTATVGATTTTPAVSEVSIYGIWVTLTLDAAPAAGATVTLAYAPPASNPVQDEAGNDAPAFSGQKVNGAAVNTAATDRAALVALYNATSGPNWTINTNWLTTAALSEWYGVTTDVDGRVTHVYLAQNELNGELPVELGDLTNLQILYLNQNMLSGAIPVALGKLTNLEQLYLSQNMLSGAIPAALGDLTNLQILYLNQNMLSGAIPVALGKLTNLEQLYLSQNMLSGAIPAKLGETRVSLGQ